MGTPANTIDALPENRIILTHWEPDAYRGLPPERKRFPVFDCIVAALTYTHVFVKDTDLILNGEIRTAFRSDGAQFRVFRELLRNRLVKVLVRPLNGTIPPHIDSSRHPLTARAYTIRSLGADDFDPTTNECLMFVGAVEGALNDGFNTVVPVNEFPRDVNPFGVWMNFALSRHRELVQIPDFSDIDGSVAETLMALSSDKARWLSFLGRNGRLKAGDEDGKFFRSQAYRILACIPGDHTATHRLLQSIFNSVYCYWENAVGVYSADTLVEPPLFGFDGAPEDANFETLQPEPASEFTISAYMSEKLVDAILRVRDTTAFKRNLQVAIHMLGKGRIARRVVEDALNEVAETFARKYVSVSEGRLALEFRVSWSLIGVLAGIVSGIAVRSVEQASTLIQTVPAVCTLAPQALRVYQWRKLALKHEAAILQACAYRRSWIEVPEEIAVLRRL